MAQTKIDWADVTINPITGCRNFGNPEICGDYCYAARMARRLKGRFGYPADDPFRPTFHPDRLQEINWKRNKTPSRIFLNSMADWFSDGVDPDWIRQIIEAVSQNDDDVFLVLTKRPERILEMIHCIALPENLWWGVSVTKQEDLWRIAALRDALPGVHKFVSFEPLHGPIECLDELDLIEWAIIGAESGRRVGRIKPEFSWIDHLAATVMRAAVPLFIKDNVFEFFQCAMNHRHLRQFPEAMS